MILGVVGHIASGKSVLSSELERRGFVKFSFSSEVRAEAERRGIPIERSRLQDLGNEMRREFGRDFWAKKILEKVENGKDYVIDGFRNEAEVLIFKKRDDFLLIGVEAPLEKRFQRIMLRGKDSDPTSMDEIKKIEARDRGEGEDEFGQQSSKCIGLADFIISNEGSKEEFRNKINEFIEKIFIERKA